MTTKMSTAIQAQSSFHKKAKIKIGQILGTRPSLYNNQLLISSGIPSLDNVIGKYIKTKYVNKWAR